MIYKFLNNIIHEDEFLQLNFQLNSNERCGRLIFVKHHNFDSGKNILRNHVLILILKEFILDSINTKYFIKKRVINCNFVEFDQVFAILNKMV